MFKGILRVEKGLFCLPINPYCDVINPFNYNFPIKFFIVLFLSRLSTSRRNLFWSLDRRLTKWSGKTFLFRHSTSWKKPKSWWVLSFVLSLTLSFSFFLAFSFHFISLILSLSLKVSRMKNEGVDPGGFRSFNLEEGPIIWFLFLGFY